MSLARQVRLAAGATLAAFVVVALAAMVVVSSDVAREASLWRQTQVVDSLRQLQLGYAELALAETRFLVERKVERATESVAGRNRVDAALLELRASAVDPAAVLAAQELGGRQQSASLAWAQAGAQAQAGRFDEAAHSVVAAGEERRAAEAIATRELARALADRERYLERHQQTRLLLTVVLAALALASAGSVLLYVLSVIRGARTYLNRTVTAVAQVADDLTAAAERQARGSNEQAQAVEQVTATMEQLSRTADQIAGATEQTLTAAEAGQASVEHTVRAMDSLKSQVGEVARRMVMLDERSRQIGAIAGLIDEITDRTHILALNAAIESAAAGEYGRRFGVVASQVRELADQARAATTQVKTVIAEIQSATGNSLAATREASTMADSGSGLASQAGQVIGQMYEMVQTISVATQQQREAQQMVVTTMRDLAQLAQQSAANSEQAASTAAELGSTAGELRALADGNDRRRV